MGSQCTHRHKYTSCYEYTNHHTHTHRPEYPHPKYTHSFEYTNRHKNSHRQKYTHCHEYTHRFTP